MKGLIDVFDENPRLIPLLWRGIDSMLLSGDHIIVTNIPHVNLVISSTFLCFVKQTSEELSESHILL
jgi:hypothetical protein